MSSTHLADVLDQQRDDERQRATRALLRHPLLTPHRPDAAAFTLVRRHAAWLADWFARETGWSVTVDSGVARLRKTTTCHADGTRGAAHGHADAKTLFSRRRYVLACLALTALERAETQVTLGWLVDRVLVFATDQRLTEAGVVFTLDTRAERADLVAVARLLLGLGVLRKVAGDEQAFVNHSGDALYDLDRRVLATLLVTRRGPSTVAGTDPADRMHVISDDRLPDTEDGRNRAVRHALARRLLDDPVVLYADLSDDERGYFDRQRGPLLRRLTDATGMVAEVRAEGVALLDPTGETTDLGMPEEGTDGHATLLLAEYLAGRMRADTGEPVTVGELEQRMAELVREHGRHWRNDAKAPGAERELTAHALHRLAALGLVRSDGDQVTASPVLGRYHYAEATIIGGEVQ